ncbi:porin [Comamonas sp. Y33R10-2]|uniref:porin n=1 Tax=Comamonas sp. Y33R10-2 TaxID=2853257 RepID=UPI001C5C84A5|nr:porin [Comamonas sp. Y33R10-2]QXZ08472.1 porin [Comamonas sp. Y33R10-2]
MKSISATLLALLATAGTGTALAQSSVSLYGRLDTAVEQQTYAGMKVSGMTSKNSFLGLRAQEDLGSGIKAGMVLEANLNTDSGKGADVWGWDSQFNFQRRSEVNLSGDFGMVRMGAFKRASYEATAAAINWHNDDMGSTSDIYFHSITPHSNVLAYRTPNWAGATAELQYRFGEKTVWSGDITYRDAMDLGLRYERGPWGMGLGYTSSKLKGSVYGDSLKDEAYTLRASYDTGDWALGAYYQRQEDKNHWPGLESTHIHRNVLRLAGKYVLGASEFHASIGRRTISYTTHALDGSLPASTQSKSSANQWMVAYHYNLSRRTKVYGFYGHLDGTPHMQSFASLWGAASNSNFRTMGAGIRHQF